MSVLPGFPMPPLRRAGQLSPLVNIHPGQQIKVNTQDAMPITLASQTDRVKAILNQMLPKVCRQHVYRVDHAHLFSEDCEFVKWTFYNDLSVKLKVETNWMHDECEARPMVEDLEEWKATAIMCCEAGDDVWPRPKPGEPPAFQNFGQANSLNNLRQQQSLAGSQMQQQQLQLGNQLAGALGMGNIFGNAGK